ncbi:MAG: DUF4332 domain-containing protein [Candidatus Sericytochromatia bacterium]|nr:DUF4332 domain-containing protein [Candidatus Sericytochromatia bacterium]
MLAPIGNMQVARAQVRAGGIQPAMAAQPVVAAQSTVPVQVQQQVDPASQQGVYDMSRLVGNLDHLSKLFGMGIKGPGAMRFWGGGPIRRFFTSLLTGVPKESLRQYAQMADLMRVPGTKADYARILHAVGITNPVQLAQYGGSDLGATIQRGVLFATMTAKSIELAVNESKSFELPTMDELARISTAARGVTIGVQQD